LQGNEELEYRKDAALLYPDDEYLQLIMENSTEIFEQPLIPVIDNHYPSFGSTDLDETIPFMDDDDEKL
jgi:hypothetical protein